MPPQGKKFVTAEYHNGFNAYQAGQALTSNPHLQDENVGRMWYWVWGWQDAMAEDLRGVKELIMSVARPIDKRRMN